MFESKQHHDLILRGEKYITLHHPELNSVTVDEYTDLGSSKPLYYLSYQPDIVGEGDGVIVVGEAKTDNDILTNHSKTQYNEILSCQKFYEQDIYYYIFVPWKVKPCLHNYLKNFVKYNNLSHVKWKVVSEVELLNCYAKD